MKREDDDQLWDLLGKAARPQASPFFARNVLRQIREEPRWNWGPWISWRRLVPASGLAVAVAIATFFAVDRAPEEPLSGEDDLIAEIDVQDYEVVADLDVLLAADETSLWEENSSL